MSARAWIGAVVVGLAVSGAAAHPGLHHDIARVSEAIEKQPARLDLYLERAYLERLNRELDHAMSDLDMARTLDPADVRVAAERGMTLSAMGRDTEAETELTRFVARGGTAPTFAERAKVRERLGRKKEAVADYGAAIARNPDVELYMARGALQESLGDHRGAAAGYREGRALLGRAVILDLALIRVETQRKRYDAALAIVDEQLGRAAVKTDWYLRRAEVLAAAGRAGAARIDREKALREADGAVATNATGIHLLSRAKVRAVLGDVEGARHDLDLALRKSPRFAEARLMLAELGTAHIDEGIKP